MDKQTLQREAEITFANLARLTKEMDLLAARLSSPPDSLETRAAGSIVHDFYTGIEQLFEKIALLFDGEVPQGPDWHRELLRQMAQPVQGAREAVISPKLHETLKEYLRFRHLFRHMYGFELKWERFQHLTVSLTNLLSELRAAMKKLTS